MDGLSRDVVCPFCSHRGWMRAHDTEGVYQDSQLFTVVSRTRQGFINVKCPRCSKASYFDPMKVISSGGRINLVRQSAGCLPVLLLSGTGFLGTLIVSVTL